MIYEFKCCNQTFEVEQPLMAEHRANCPNCGNEAQRIFGELQWIWAGALYRPDGSKREEKDYAPVMGG